MNETKVLQLKQNVSKVLFPIKQIDQSTNISKNACPNSVRTDGGIQLQEYYLVFFLLVELLEYKNSGQGEKVAWAIPIDYKGKLYSIEYRKMGLGIFADEKEDLNAEEICKKINKAIKVAEPYFEFIAKQQVNGSKLNVNNNCKILFDRYNYFVNIHTQMISKIVDKHIFDNYLEKQQASWIALSAIDAFYSWTEHVFIHIGILQEKIKTGLDVVQFVEMEWKDKFKKIIGFDNEEYKIIYDKLVEIKTQLRNFYAHGAFGKTGEAFSFHSKTGAVPVKLTSSIKNKKTYSLQGKKGFNEKDAIAIIDNFIDILWKNSRAPAKIYLMDSDLPVILSHANDGVYHDAMISEVNMTDFVGNLCRMFDDAANMYW